MEPDGIVSTTGAMAESPPYPDVRPDFPVSYAGDQARFDRDMQLLQVRRELLERTAAIREARALILVHEADVAERRQRLQTDAATERPVLTPAQRLRLEGQARLAQARAEYLQERIVQLELERQAWAATLVTAPGS